MTGSFNDKEAAVPGQLHLLPARLQPKNDHSAIRPKDLLIILLVTMSLGLAFVGIKEMLREAPPLKAAGLRFMLAALPLLALSLQPRRFRRLKRRDFGKFAILGLCQTTIMFGINYVALQYVPAGISSIILNTNPFFVAIYAHFWLPGDRLTRRKIAGLVLGFGGVLALVLGGKGFGEIAFYWPLLLLVSAAVWGFSSVLIKLFKFEDMISATGWQAFFGSLPLLGLGFLFEPRPVHFTLAFSLWTLYVALVASSFGWWAWYGLLRRYPASKVTVFNFLIPVFGVLSGVVLLGESLSFSMLLGGALVAGGILTVNFRRSRRRETTGAVPVEPVEKLPLSAAS